MRQRLAELLSYMDATRGRLVATASDINPAFAGIRPHTDAWSAEENVSHLAVVEEGVARLIVKSIEWAKTHGVGPETSDETIMSSLDQYLLTETTPKRKAPSMVTPASDQSVDDSLAALASSRKRLKDALLSADGLDLCQVKHAHPGLGEIDMYQWALFVAQHEERHRKQIERTMDEVTELAAESAPIV